MEWPSSKGGVAHKVIGYPDAASSYAIARQTGAANTKSAYSEIDAGIGYGGFPMVSLVVSDYTEDYLFDIATGAAGSESIILPNLLASCVSQYQYGVLNPILFPIFIPKSSRLAFRAQAYGASKWCDVHIAIVPPSAFHAAQGFAKCIDYGANTADSGGTSIDPGSSANTKGSWTELSASTERTIKGVIIALGSQRNTARTNAQWKLDLSFGASNEIVIYDFFLNCRSEHDHVSPRFSPFIPVTIPAGVALDARVSCSITDATDRLVDIVVYCFV
jgi:hypothetical protein